MKFLTSEDAQQLYLFMEVRFFAPAVKIRHPKDFEVTVRMKFLFIPHLLIAFKHDFANMKPSDPLTVTIRALIKFS